MELKTIQSRIYEIRGQKVMLDFNLAELYEVETRVLNQAVKRNTDLFPEDFIIQLSPKEWESMSSQIVMTYPVKRPRVAPPYAFTEHGVAMLASVLKSPKARKTCITIIRTFIRLKQITSMYLELDERIKSLESRYDRQFKDVNDVLNFLIQKDKKQSSQENRKRIGFKKTDPYQNLA